MSKFGVSSVVAACLRFAPAALVTLALYGCGGVSEAGDESPSAEPSKSEIGSIEQAYGESTCVNVLDHQCGTLGTGNTCVAMSPDANYDHAGCTHTWVAQVTTTVPHGVLGIYRGVEPDGNTFPCNTAWVRMTIWRKQGQLWKLSHPDKLVQGSKNRLGSCSGPEVIVQTLEPGTYKIMVQAGFIVYYQQVQVTVL